MERLNWNTLINAINNPEALPLIHLIIFLLWFYNGFWWFYSFVDFLDFFLNTGLIAYLKFFLPLMAAIPSTLGYLCIPQRYPHLAKGLHTFQMFLFKTVKLKPFLLPMFDCTPMTWHLHFLCHFKRIQEMQGWKTVPISKVALSGTHTWLLQEWSQQGNMERDLPHRVCWSRNSQSPKRTAQGFWQRRNTHTWLFAPGVMGGREGHTGAGEESCENNSSACEELDWARKPGWE